MKTILLITLILVAGFSGIGKTAVIKGFCIDVANIICEKHKLDPEFVMFTSVPDLLGAVESGVCDIGFAGITITAEREKRVDFSQPFFESGLMIAVRSEPLSQITSMGNAILRVIGLSIVLFFVGLTDVAHLVCWIERDDDVKNRKMTPKKLRKKVRARVARRDRR